MIRSMLGLALGVLLASCETTEQVGVLTAREVKVGEGGALTLVGGSITLTDPQGRRSVLTASRLVFYGADGKPVAEVPAPAAAHAE